MFSFKQVLQDGVLNKQLIRRQLCDWTIYILLATSDDVVDEAYPINSLSELATN